MMFRRQILGAVLLTVCSSIASGQLEVVEEHVFDFGMAATPWEMSVLVPYYDPADYGGRPLEEVMVMLEGGAESEVDVTATGGDVLVISGNVGAYISASGFVSGLTLDVLPSGDFAPPVQQVPNGTMLNLTDISGTDSEMLVLAGSQNVAQFVGAGTFSVAVDSLGTSQMSTSGGNMDASQRTDAEARLTVQYKAVAVPEPATGIMLLLSMLGFGLLRRK